MPTTEQLSPQEKPPLLAKKSTSPSIWEIYFPRRISGHRECIYIASFPEIILFWPTIFVCYLCAFLQVVSPVVPVYTGWLIVFVLSLNFLIFVHDFDQKQFAIFILFVVVCGLAAWIANLYGFRFFTFFTHWLFGLQPIFSSDALLLIGSILFLYFLWGLVIPLFDHWKLEQNEFVHFTQPLGRDMSIARQGCTVYREIPDIFEYLLTLGGGSLVIKRDNHIVATIPNVPLLGMKMQAIEHMLSEMRVSVAKEG